MVRCGAPAPRDARETSDPVIVVEVLSPSNTAIDMSRKLDAYMRHPTVRHYLMIDVDRRIIVRHAKGQDGRIATALLRDGSLTLDPPGLTVEVASMFDPV
jgi:Uma2 family endonuclease